MKWFALMLASMSALPVSANPNAATKRYIVGFKTGTPQAVRDRVLKRLGATRQVMSIKSKGTSSDEFEASVVEAPAGASVPSFKKAGLPSFRMDVFGGSAAGSAAPISAGPAGLSAAAGEEGVYIEEDYKVKWIESAPAATFQNTALPNFGAFMNTVRGALPKIDQRGVSAAAFSEYPWGIKRVKAPAAWSVTQGRGVKVAVIDTGVKTDHSDLSGQVIGGYNAIEDSDKDGSYEDDNGHGTHVAGTIAAKRNGRGVVGVAPQVMLYAIKVLDKDGSGNLSDVIKGIIWAANNEIQVANMSLGSPMPSEAMRRALRYAKGHGMVIVAAAGNSCSATTSCSVGYPGAYPETIAVAASDSDDKIAEFSSRGAEVKFIAPGVDVVSSWKNGNWVSLSGTSMAAPHVAGLAALAVAQGARGLGGPDGVLFALTKASKDIGLKPQEEGKGMIDAGKIVE